MNCSLTIFFSVLLDDLGDGVLFSLSPLSLTVFTMTGSSRLPSHSMKKVSALYSHTTLFCLGEGECKVLLTSMKMCLHSSKISSVL